MKNRLINNYREKPRKWNPRSLYFNKNGMNIFTVLAMEKKERTELKERIAKLIKGR